MPFFDNSICHAFCRNPAGFLAAALARPFSRSHSTALSMSPSVRSQSLFAVHHADVRSSRAVSLHHCSSKCHCCSPPISFVKSARRRRALSSSTELILRPVPERLSSALACRSLHKHPRPGLPSCTALAIAAAIRRMARMASSLPGNHIVDLIGITVGIDDGHDGDAQLASLGIRRCAPCGDPR